MYTLSGVTKPEPTRALARALARAGNARPCPGKYIHNFKNLN